LPDLWLIFKLLALFGMALLVFAAVFKKTRRNKAAKALKVAQTDERNQALQSALGDFTLAMERVREENLEIIKDQADEIRKLTEALEEKCAKADTLASILAKTTAMLNEKNEEIKAAMNSKQDSAQTDNDHFRAEVIESFESTYQNSLMLRDRISTLEEAFKILDQRVSELLSDNGSEVQKFDKNLIKELVSAEISNQISGLVDELDGMSEVLDNELGDMSEFLNADLISSSTSSPSYTSSTQKGASVNTLPIFVASSPSKENVLLSDNSFSDLKNKENSLSYVAKVDKSKLAEKNYCVEEILSQHKKGVSIPQIASNLEISKAKVDLILKFYNQPNTPERRGAIL